MKPSSFTVTLTFVILMIIGVAVAPLIDVGTEPAPRQGKTLTIRYEWPNVSAKVIEQNLTSPIEGMVAALKGVASVSSTSYFGSNEIVVKLKEKTDVSSVRFEISSLLRQSYGRLPKGISFPTISGGEVVDDNSSHHDQKLLLTYQVNAELQPNMIKSFVEQHVQRQLEGVDGVCKVEITGTTDSYLDITYDPILLSAYGISAHDMAEGIKNYIGQDEIIGTVMHHSERGNEEKITLHLTAAAFDKALEQMPLKNVSGKMIYLNDLAAIRLRDKDPNNYYRVNGLNTIYANVYIPADGKVVKISDRVQKEMDNIKSGIHQKMYIQLSYDSAKQQREEMSKLIWRTLMSLTILLVFVWITNRNLKYLFIITSTLAANLLIAIIAFWVFHIKLHIYSLAGITVSLGLIIDSTIVMADHYGYYHNRKAFLSILAAMLTTIGSMIIIFFLPKEIQQDLYDFAWIVIINLAISLLVALFFVPAIIDRCHYSSQRKQLRGARWIVKWNHGYLRYIRFTSRRKWIYYAILVLAFGIPFHALPDKMGPDDYEVYVSKDKVSQQLTWYEHLYNSTLGSAWFQADCKPFLSQYLGGCIHLFADYLHDSAYRRGEAEEKVLHILAKMPVGGTAVQLNSKIIAVEEMLKSYDGIKDFTTRIDGRNGEIVVNFKKNAAKTNFPYQLENDVIGKVITIGGADWATFGVSERGFSNALNLQHRSERITITGYNYEQLYRLAEDMSDYMSKNKRVQDLTIETPNHENQEDELYMKYDKENMNVYHANAAEIHSRLREMWMPTYVGYYRDQHLNSDVYLTPKTSATFDLWHLENKQIALDSGSVLIPELMSIKRREAKNVIPKENQEYVLNVAFNVLGSYTYTANYIENVIKHFNKTLPVGYRCKNTYYTQPINESSNYWLLSLVVIIVFFICTILFESIRLAFVIISVVPVALMGTFLTFCLTGVDFGSGGFASLVLLTGIVVNSGIYILSQYRNIRKKTRHRRSMLDYICAYNHKIIPILLTVASTIMGLIPFFIDGKEEPFWFSFATGVTGGLVFSIPALIFIMPIFINFRKKVF